MSCSWLLGLAGSMLFCYSWRVLLKLLSHARRNSSISAYIIIGAGASQISHAGERVLAAGVVLLTAGQL